MDDSLLLQEMTNKLVETLHPKRIYLFGSRARGDAGPDSDYDFLVLVEGPLPERESLDLKGYLAQRGFDASKDVLVWTEEYFERKAEVKASLSSTVLREGKLLYAA